jgi:hypothetical protein
MCDAVVIVGTLVADNCDSCAHCISDINPDFQFLHLE